MSDLRPATDPKSSPNLSLVIPTLRRRELLERLLSSLLAQQLETGAFEVIVVDNTPAGDKPTQELCLEDKFKMGLDLRYAHQPERGANGARNFGTALARADWVGFIDDDETLPPDFVSRALQTCLTPAPDGFGGPYIPYFETAKPVWFKDDYLLVWLGPNARWLEKDEALNGGNMFFKRSWLVEMGGFPRRFGRSGDNLGYGDETDLMLRMTQKGARLWYDPQLFILHFTPADRMSVRWFMRSKWLHGKAKAHIRFRDPANRDDRSRARVALSGIKVLLQKCFKIAFLYAAVPVRDRQKYPYPQNYVVEVICPQVSGFSTAWHFLNLNLEREESRRQLNV